MSKVDDSVCLDAVLAALPPAYALWVSRQFERPCQTARRRLEARTQALRAARPVIAPGMRPRPAAEAIASELLKYMATAAWKEQKHQAELPASAFERHRVLHRVAVLNWHKPICWRLVFDALRRDDPAKG